MSRRGMADCIHHWLIDPAESATSEGKCQKCGAVQVFANSLAHDVYWQSKGKQSREKGTMRGHQAMGHKIKPLPTD
jgi:hypothetical protein